MDHGKRSVCMLTAFKNHTCTIIQGRSDKVKPDGSFCIIMQKRMLIYPIKWHRTIVVYGKPLNGTEKLLYT